MRIISWQLKRAAARSLDEKIEQRVVRDATGCWKWTGPCNRKRRDSAYVTFLNKHINVRKYLWTQSNGQIPKKYVLQHKDDVGCSHSMECVSPEHMRMLRAATLRISGHEWRGTLWEPDPNGQCRNCRRPYEWHGADEWTVKKLGLALNQQHQVCKPGDSKPKSSDVVGPITTLRSDRGKRKGKAAHTPPRPEQQTGKAADSLPRPQQKAVARSINTRESQSEKHANPPRERQNNSESRGNNESKMKMHPPECSCSRCAPPRSAVLKKLQSARKAAVCLRSLRCRVADTELRGEMLYCTYCGLLRTADGPSAEHAHLGQFEAHVSEEADEP